MSDTRTTPLSGDEQRRIRAEEELRFQAQRELKNKFTMRAIYGTIALSLPFAASLSAQTQAPGIDSIVNSANYSSHIAFNSILSIFGSQLATGVAQAQSLPFPRKLGDTEVLVCHSVYGINCVTAALIFVSPTQINAILPDSPGSTLSDVSGEIMVRVSGFTSAPKIITIKPAAAGIYRMACPFTSR